MDNNEIHISAIIHIVNCNHNIKDVRDDEYWGFLVIYAILNISKEVINVESKIETLY